MSAIINSPESDHATPKQSGFLARITVEHALYLLVLIVAAILRLPGLGNIPLSPQEASEALAVWNLWQPGLAEVAVGSPAYFTLSAILTQVVGYGDTIMRLVPALFGCALVMLPWFLRDRNGRLGALIVSLLLALSPILNLTSRTASGLSLALFAGLLIFVAWLNYQASGRTRWFYVLVLALGFGLASAPLFYGLLITLGLAWLIHVRLGPFLFKDQTGQRRSLFWPKKGPLRTAVIIGLVTFIFASTVFTLFPSGLGAAADLLIQWLSQMGPPSNVAEWLSPFLAIAQYEFILLLIGIPATIWVARTGRSYPIFLVYWLAFGLIVTILQGGDIFNSLLIILPGYLLIGCFLNDILKGSLDWYEISLSIVLLITGGVIFINVGRYSRLASIPGSGSGTFHALLALVALLFTAILLILIWSWDSRTAKKGLILGLLIFLFMITWGNTWWTVNQGANDTRERWVDIASDNDLRLLTQTMTEISWQVSNSENDVEVISAIDSPALRWYLRDFSNLEMGDGLSTSSPAPLLITTSESSPILENDYIGTDFGHLRPNTLHRLDFASGLRWWMFRESSIPINEERLILWLRSDLTGENQ